MNLNRISILTVLSVGAFSGCVQQTVEPTFVRESSDAVDYAYIASGADFSKYTKLTTDGLEIYFPESDAPPPKEEIDRIRATFIAAFTEAIGNDYEVVQAPGPDVLKVRAQLIDMKVTGADSHYAGSGKLKSLVAHGELTFLMEMIDSQSGDVLARAADRTKDVSSGEDAAEWEDVDRAARHWAGLFRNWLDRSLGEPNQE